MSFNLTYTTLRRCHLIRMPDFYLGFVSTEDLNQLHYGLSQKNQTEPNQQTIRQAAINLAKHRIQGKS